MPFEWSLAWLRGWVDHPVLLTNTPRQLASALLACLLAFVVFDVLLRVVTGQMARIARRTPNPVDDALAGVMRHTVRMLLIFPAMLVGTALLQIPERWELRLHQAMLLALIVQLGLWGNAALSAGMRSYRSTHAVNGVAQTSAAMTLAHWGALALLWIVLGLAALGNLGVDVTALVTSLGIGGIAVALAVQNILSDVFASMVIAIDKPFEVGDSISVNGFSGSVEYIGIKTTRLRAGSGEQIVMANTDMLKNPVSNFTRLKQRRVNLKFGVAGDTSAGQAAKLPAVAQRCVGTDPVLKFERAHLTGIGDYALNFEVVYVVLTADYGVHMDQQQRVVLALIDELAVLGLRLAAPTRSILMPGPVPAHP